MVLFMIALLPQHLDQPHESQLFYRMGVKWLYEAEALLAKQGTAYTGAGSSVLDLAPFL